MNAQEITKILVEIEKIVIRDYVKEYGLQPSNKEIKEETSKLLKGIKLINDRLEL